MRRKNNGQSALRVTVFGVVQGVGFRPFLFRLAERFGYKGWVKNISTGVEIHLEAGEKTDFSRFLRALRERKPSLARIESVSVRPSSFRGHSDFRILKSKGGESFVFISPDIATCRPCRGEIANPAERRYRYPFTNCTDCGPRYTIVRSLPYDRHQTTMAGFAMCADCRREYDNPRDRRYHAQPIACPACGPRVTLREARTAKVRAGGIEEAVVLIKKGKLLAVKGLGGFHLVCDPQNKKAVLRLRRLKKRRTKPLALMARDLKTIWTFAFINPEEKRQLLSASRPIVLLKKRKEIPFVAPHLDEVGFMLPYTPLHHLLLQDLSLIVATSSNLKDAPIAKDEGEGMAALCDFVLTHDRPIETRADDSVLKVAQGKPLFLRRARGYVPYPQSVPEDLRFKGQILALGAELKDTISVYKNGYVITSQFLGDLDEYENYRYFEETVAHLCRLFDVKPGVVVSDLHPHFRTTRWAEKSGLRHLRVQHHFAHILAVLIEQEISPGQKVLGVALDGYGYGADGGAWGGEFLLADYSSFSRIASFRSVPLPGGDLAAREPWRMALSYLLEAFGSALPEVAALRAVEAKKLEAVAQMIGRRVNSPPTSSCGRLFDAVSFLAGVAPMRVEFEAEAPMRLEALSRRCSSRAYPFSLDADSLPWQLSFAETIRGIVADLKSKAGPERIGSAFHRTLAEGIAAVAAKAKTEYGIGRVVLVGGVFLNRILLSLTRDALEKKRLEAFWPVRYSPNDESISLGQIAFALEYLRRENPDGFPES